MYLPVGIYCMLQIVKLMETIFKYLKCFNFLNALKQMNLQISLLCYYTVDVYTITACYGIMSATPVPWMCARCTGNVDLNVVCVL